MKLIKRISKSLIGQKFLGFIIFIITKFIFTSIRWKCLDISNKNLIYNSKKPYIFCCWHNKLFLGPYFLPKHFKINALQSSHSDGMMTAILFKLMKINIIFGSSKKEGSKAFFNMVKSIKKGESVAITPDGPKGPREKVKDGIIKLAQVTGAPIIPLVWFTNKNKKLDSWDKFVIPYPFSKGNYVFGKAIFVNRKLNQNELKQKKQSVEDTLKKLTWLAEK
tara:strand:- start:491 stop:1153 length:663 start_codon:yes stop_codon:yes gene_type:complete